MAYDAKAQAEIARLKTILDTATPSTEDRFLFHPDEIDRIVKLNQSLAATAGGSSGGVSLTQADIQAAIDAATDINAIVNSLGTIATNTPALGQALAANSTPVVLTTAQLSTITPPTTVASTQSGSWTVVANTGLTQPLTDTQLRALALPVSVAALPLPNGATTAANQATIITRLTSIESRLQSGYRSNPTIIRDANTTVYAVNDVYGAPFELTNIGSSGGHILLSGVRIIFNIAVLPSGMSGFLLYLYTTPPPSAVIDNGAFSVPAGDRAALITPVGIDIGSASVGVGGGSVTLAIDNLNIQLKLNNNSTSLFGYLVTRSGFAPLAPSETASLIAISLGV